MLVFELVLELNVRCLLLLLLFFVFLFFFIIYTVLLWKLSKAKVVERKSKCLKQRKRHRTVN